MRPINWSGIDVGKDSFEGSILAWTEEREIRGMICREFPRTKDGVNEYLNWVDSNLLKVLGPPENGFHGVRIIMDATGRFSLELYTMLMEARESLEPSIINPRYLKHFIKSLGVRNKTDDIDARGHCLYGYERKPQPYQPPRGVYKELKELVRSRNHFVKARTAQTNRLSESNQLRFVENASKRHLKFLDREIEKIENKMRKVASKDAIFQNDLNLMQTMPGVGETTAFKILVNLGDLRNYKSAKRISAATGLSPKRHDSGKYRGRCIISREGPSELRSALYMACLSNVVGDHQLARKYRKFVDAGKPKKLAMCVIMRQIPVVLRAMVINDEPYRIHS